LMGRRTASSYSSNDIYTHTKKKKHVSGRQTARLSVGHDLQSDPTMLLLEEHLYRFQNALGEAL
jgi:ABC-type uncharacterized transport system YnjBCD ATPase subunit